ncbi:MAG: sugar phosphate nucleotidyltransferase [Patescibacteria group bacterium]
MDRKRLTITLRQDLLPRIDEVIDGSRIRNRSHAIEYLLSQSLGASINKAFILAGGRGIKMRPLTYEIPKSLLPINGKPILEYTIQSLRDSGFKDIYILIGHLGDKIVTHFGDGSRFGVKITYINEKKELGTAAPLTYVEKYLKRSPFIMMYGDVLADINIDDFVDTHKSHSGLATVAVTSSAKPQEFGVVRLHGNRIVSFNEKPQGKKNVSHFINAGMFVFNPEIFKYVPKRGQAMLEFDVFPRLAREGKLYSHPFSGQWYDVGTPAIYEEALREWKKRRS